MGFEPTTFGGGKGLCTKARKGESQINTQFTTVQAAGSSPRLKMSYVTTQASTRVDRVTVPPSCSQVVSMDYDVSISPLSYYLMVLIRY
jgi:hypothetical protein